jgi:hypothetical protein
MLAVLVDFSVQAITEVGPLVLWVLIWSAIYSGLERIFPRLGGSTPERKPQPKA